MADAVTQRQARSLGWPAITSSPSVSLDRYVVSPVAQLGIYPQLRQLQALTMSEILICLPLSLVLARGRAGRMSPRDL